MNLSMSKKIFGIVFMLLMIAATICGLGSYSISNLNGQIQSLSRQANRSLAVHMVDKTVLDRELALEEIIVSLDEEEMRALIGEMEKHNVEMDRTLAFYTDNLSPTSNADQMSRPKRLGELWAAYDKVTRDVAALSLGNSNARADRASAALIPVWAKADEELRLLADALFENEDRDTQRLALTATAARAMLTSFRLESVKFNLNTDSSKIKEIEGNVLAMRQAIVDAMASVVDGAPAGRTKERAVEILDTLKNNIDPVLEIVIPLVNLDSNNRARALYRTEGRAAQTALSDYSGELVTLANTLMEDTIATASATGQRINMLMLALSGVGMLVGLILAWTTIRAITRRLTMIIHGLGEGSRQVHAAASQISSASHSLAEGVTQTAASLEQTSSALEQMASMTKQNAANAAETNLSTTHAKDLISAGAEAVADMSTAMREISGSANEINRIIQTIEDIAFQTNLLALNAAVEAARAGESGKGFAVVADEVRSLAGRSAQAARDTTNLIHSTVERIQSGQEIADRLHESFREIQDGSTSVSKLIGEITVATNEQAEGVNQVNIAVAEMDKVTQANAAASEESASASEQLSAQATQLNDIVDDLLVLVEGGAAKKRGGMFGQPGNGNGNGKNKGNGNGNGKRKKDTFEVAKSGGQPLQLTCGAAAGLDGF